MLIRTPVDLLYHLTARGSRFVSYQQTLDIQLDLDSELNAMAFARFGLDGLAMGYLDDGSIEVVSDRGPSFQLGFPFMPAQFDAAMSTLAEDAGVRYDDIDGPGMHAHEPGEDEA
jgi:hypothetical protein